MSRISVALSLALALCCVFAQDDVTVDVDIPDLGIIQGRLGVTSRDQTPYWTFHGIPYAEESSYMGENRFKPSQVKRTQLSDDGRFEANRILVFCPQGELFDLDGLIPEEQIAKAQDIPGIFRAQHQKKREMSRKLREVSTTEERMKILRDDDFMGIENCLTININTPKSALPADPENLLPVIVFFHGGGSDSVWGSAFTALRIEEHPVVLVTLNYRLGVLGAFNLQTDDAPGNAGLYDGITALEWVHDYIQYFGGDPKKVTITGQSAGAMMVSNLLISPLVTSRTGDDQLFHGVWGFSGAAISVWAVSEEPSLPNHLRIAELAGCYEPVEGQQPDIPAITSCMKNDASLDALVKALSLWKHEEEIVGRLGYDARMPSIQHDSITIPKFMPRHPFETMEMGEALPVPVVLGATRHDGSYPLDDIFTNFIQPNNLHKNESWVKNEMLPYLLSTLGIKDITGELYHVMQKTFLRDAANTPTFEDKLPGTMDMVTTMAFKAGELEMLRWQTKIGQKAFHYSLDYVGRWSLYNFLWGDMYMPGGICHTDDLIYFFWLGPLMNDDMRVSRRWVKYFVNFATYGDPNGPDTSPVVWKPYDPMTHSYLSMNLKDKNIEHASNFWVGPADEIFENWSPPTDPTPTPTGSTDDPTGPTDDPTGPTGNPTGSTDDPTGPTGNPTGPTDDPTGPTDDPTGPTDDPTGPTGDPTGSTDDPATGDPGNDNGAGSFGGHTASLLLLATAAFFLGR